MSIDKLQPFASGYNQPLKLPYGTAALPYVNSNFYGLKVNGKGSILAEPDKAIAVLGVITENMQLELAQRENAEKTAAVINSLIRMGIPKEDIQTQAFTIQPVYDYSNGKQVFKGYRVTHNLKVSIDNMAMVGRIIDSAVESGANSVSSINFTISDPSDYYNEALNAAISDALEKAMVIGDKLRAYVYPVPIRVIEQTSQQGLHLAQTAMMQSSDTVLQVQPGQIEITALIEATFSYKAGG